jgi:hypothetical protein
MASDFTDTIGIFQGDIIVKSAIELALEHLRDNPWVLEDIFRSLLENPILSRKYGMKEINRAKEFILNNNIPIYMVNRIDTQEFPCITIAVGASQEDKSAATLGDMSVMIEEYSPSDIQQTIPFIVPPFVPTSYDINTGIVEMDPSVVEYKYIGTGMVVIETSTGRGFIINGKSGVNGFQIAVGSEINASELAIIPQYAVFRGRRERAISQESYNIGCHVQGDPSTLIFLYSVVKYALFRYREGLLEANNFQLSNLSSTPIIHDDSFGVENVYSRGITLSGQVEESWVKTPYRVIEAVDLIDNSSTTGYTQGVQIVSQTGPAELSTSEDLWITIK